MTHTPGPWTASEPSELDGKCSVYANGPIAYLGDNGAGIENVQANANLMAAAPELLAALENAQKWLAKMVADESHLGAVMPNHCVQTLEQVHSAINKAKGVRT